MKLAILLVALVSATVPGKNGMLLYQVGSTEEAFGVSTDIVVANANGKNIRGITPDSFYDGNGAWSPNGRRIAFERRVGSGQMDIWTMDALGRHKKELTFSDGDDGNPAWSPDGKQIVFQSNRTGRDAIWVMNADGTNQHVLVPTTGDVHRTAPSWSPDGTKIVYVTETIDCTPVCYGHWSLWEVAPDGSGNHLLETSPNVDNDPVWSPDGSKIAFESNRGGDYDVYVMNADGTGIRDLTNHPALDASPAWSPDGKRLAFVSDRAKKGLRQIYEMNADGSHVVRITHEGVWTVAPDWQRKP